MKPELIDTRGPVEQTYYGDYILRLPLSEIRRIKRAVNVLARAGMQYHDAVSIVIHAHNERRRYV